MKNPLVYICMTFITVSMSFVVRPFLPSRTVEAHSVADGEQVTYFCTETKQVIVGPAQELPAVNPATGRRTLQRALYCSVGKKWWPAPAPGAYQGNPLTAPCPHHHVPMSPVGPTQPVTTSPQQ